MASEEIKLVGSFKDDITPQLKKLNRSLDKMGQSFESFNKKLKPITKNFNKMAKSAEKFSVAMSGQQRSISTSARAMKEYSRQAGKMSAAMRRVEQQRAKATRQQGVSRSQIRKGGGMGPGGGGGMSGGGGGGGGGGAAYGAAAAKGFNSGIGSIAIGSAIGNIASQAMMRGMAGLKNMALAPFKKFGAMFSERIGDEMDDIKSAGGLFALDMDLTQASGNERFFKNYNEALRFQEKLNIDMAESAASLPGVTSQYVATSRQLTDTIQMVMEKDREGFNKLAQGYGANVTAGGVDASKEAMRTVLQKQTEQVILQSQGQTGGLPMHIAIQQLLGKEKGKIKMQAFTNKFRAAFQKNPLLKNFLLRAEKDMNNTAAGSADRLKIIMDTFDRAMPKEVINKMRGSISGMQEALRSGLLDPQAGLFGMSRAAFGKDGKKLMKKNVDDFGNVLFKITDDLDVTAEMLPQLEKLGLDKKVGESIKGLEFTAEQLQSMGLSAKQAGIEVSKSSTYIFEQIREIMAGFGPVLLEFVGFLPQLFDPFGEMTENLMSFRDKSQAFISGFNKNIDIIDEHALMYSNMADPRKQGLGSLLKGQARSRAAMATLADFLNSMGGIEKGLFDKVKALAGDTSEKGIGAFADKAAGLGGEMIKSILNSDMMRDFGKIGGIIVGGITKVVIQMIQMATGAFKGQGVNKLTDGFMEGFKEAFGDMDFNEVKSTLVDAAVIVLSKTIEVVFGKVLPALLVMYIEGLFKGLTEGGPLTKLFAGLGLVKLGAMVVTATTSLMALAKAASASALAMGLSGRAGPAMAGGGMAMKGGRAIRGAASANNLALAGIGAKMGGGRLAKLLGPLSKLGGGKGKAVAGLFAGAAGLAKFGPKLAGAAKGIGGLVKGIPLLNVAFAGMDFAAQKAQGKTNFQAGAGAGGGLIGSIIGGALGSFLGPIGTMIGAALGGWLGSSLGEAIGNMDWSWAGEAWNGFTDGVGKAWEGVSKVAGDVGNWAGDVWNNFTTTIGDEFAKFDSDKLGYIAEAAGFMFQTVINNIQSGWGLLVNFFTVTLPEGWSMVIGFAVGLMQASWQGITNFFTVVIPNTFNGLREQLAVVFENIKSGITTLVEGVKAKVSEFVANIGSLPGQIAAGLESVTAAIMDWVSSLPGKVMGGIGGAIANITERFNIGRGNANYMGNIGTAASGQLGDAIRTELRNKPSGSDLVIANSSETIIPATGFPASNGGGGGGVGGVSIGAINISGVDDPREIANQVAEEIMHAMQRAAYSEINVS